ncbi:hypothetical protein ABFX02_14G244100 [Erythranthe guttata]
MGRAPCCDKANVKKGPWSPEEDAKLKEFIEKFGTGGNWIALPQKVGLKRCGKSCRLRWLNYLRPNIRHGEFSDEEDKLICTLYATIGSRWSIIAAQLPGRTDNDIKNYWNTKLKKKLMSMIIPSSNQAKFPPPFSGTLQNYQPLYNNDYNYSSFYSFQASANYKSLQTISAPPQNHFLYTTNNSDNNNNNFSLSTTTAAAATQYPYGYDQNQGLVDFQYYGKDDNNNNNMLVFGGNDHQPSCSSSDGSCSQVTYGGRDYHIKQEEIMAAAAGVCRQGFVISNNGVEEKQKFMLINNPNITDHHKANGVLENSCNNGSIVINNNGGNSFLFNDDDDENKTCEKRMYYYYQ